MRWLLIAAALLLAGCVAPAQAGQKIELWYGPGGDVFEANKKAYAWKRNRNFIIIRDIQASADALAVIFAFKELKVPMCYGKSRFNATPRLDLHQTKFRTKDKKGRTVWGYRDEAFIRWGIRTPIDGSKKLHPREVGIPACPKGIKADRKVTPGPQIWYPRPRSYGKRSPWR